MSRMKQVAFAAAVVAFGSQLAHAQSIVKVDGSSTVFPITEAVAEDFQKSVKGNVKVTVGISGTAAASRSSVAARSTSRAHRVRS